MGKNWKVPPGGGRRRRRHRIFLPRIQHGQVENRLSPSLKFPRSWQSHLKETTRGVVVQEDCLQSAITTNIVCCWTEWALSPLCAKQCELQCVPSCVNFSVCEAVPSRNFSAGLSSSTPPILTSEIVIQISIETYLKRITLFPFYQCNSEIYLPFSLCLWPALDGKGAKRLGKRNPNKDKKGAWQHKGSPLEREVLFKWNFAK